MRECTSLNWLSEKSRGEMLLWQEILINMTKCSSWKPDLNQCHLQINTGGLEAAVNGTAGCFLFLHAVIVSSLTPLCLKKKQQKNAAQKALTRCQKQQLKAAIMVKMTARKKSNKKNQNITRGSWGRQMPTIILLSQSTEGTGNWLVLRGTCHW